MIESRKYCIRIVSKMVSKAQSLYLKQRLENAVQKKITDFLNS